MAQHPLVATRVLPPKLAGPILRRPRLLDALSRHLHCKLLLLTADAGYGKTTLLSGLIEEAEIPCAWYRVERSDRDPSAFLEGLLEAIRRHFPGFGERLGGRMQAGEVRPPVAVAHLIDDLVRLPPLLVALDDYHHVDKSQETNKLVDGLLEHLPSAIHLLISSRTIPHLSLSRLRAQNSLFELDSDSLRFTPEEIEALFAMLGLHLDADTLQILLARTEGWVLGLMLAYHSVREKGEDEVRAFLRGLRGSARYIYDYLSAEVFRTQPPPVQSFLRATSILPRLHPDLCNDLLEITTAGETLRYLERNNLFTHSLDEERAWYRYHPLFQEFLQARLQVDEGASHILGLRRRASAILESRGFFEEAFEQYSRAEEWEDAGRLLAELGGRLLEMGRLQMLSHLLEELPPSIVEHSAGLLLLQGRQREIQGRWVEARARFAGARELFAAREDTGGMLQALAGLALTHVRQGQYSRAMEICAEALALASPDGLRWRVEVLRLLAGCFLETDDLDRGAQHMEEALEAFRTLGDRRAEARVLHNLAYSVRFVRGDFRAALRMEEDAVHICEELGDVSTLGLCLIGLGHLRLVMGQHEEAMVALERLLRLCEEWQAEPGRAYALVLMADTCREQGDRSRARLLYEEALTLGERLEEPTVRLHSLIGLALLLRRDDAAGARALAGRALALAQQLKSEWFRGRSLVALGVIIGGGQGEDGATHLLEAVHIFEHLRAQYDLARAHLLLASLLSGEARRHHLEETLILGERGAHEALFLHSEREAAHPLLVEALTQGIRPDYVGRLLTQAGASEDLLPLLHHPDPLVRARSARLLADLGERRARTGLQRLLRDRERRVREAAEQALEQLSRRPPPPLRVRVLGAFRLFRGDESVPEAAWKRSAAKALFQYLVSQRPRMMPEEAILEALWPGAEAEAAHTAFHAALHALRKALEPHLEEARNSAYILGQKDRYGLNPRAECWVDAEEFARLAHLGKTYQQTGRIEEATRALLEADRLYAGNYLEESPHLEWAAADRERLRQIEIEVLLRLGDLMARSDPHAAINAFRRAIAVEPYCEPAYRGLMRLLAQTGQRAEALRQYQLLERILQQDLQATPSPEVTTLYRQLLGQDT